jgi:transposase
VRFDGKWKLDWAGQGGLPVGGAESETGVMGQLQLPMFPSGTKLINNNVGVECKEGKVVYLHGHLPVFQHEAKDLKSFRYFTSQMVDTGVVRAGEVVEAFGVPLGTVKRYLNVYRAQGGSGFFQTKQRKRSATKLTGENKEKAEQLLRAGHAVAEVSRQTGVLTTTLHKAIKAGRLESKKKSLR